MTELLHISYDEDVLTESGVVDLTDKAKSDQINTRTKKRKQNKCRVLPTKQSLTGLNRNCCRSPLSPYSSHKHFSRICLKRRRNKLSCETCQSKWFIRRHLLCKGRITCPVCQRGYQKPERYAAHLRRCCRSKNAKLENPVSTGENVPGEVVKGKKLPSKSSINTSKVRFAEGLNVERGVEQRKLEKDNGNSSHEASEEKSACILDENIELKKDSEEQKVPFQSIEKVAMRLASKIEDLFKEEQITDMSEKIDIFMVVLDMLGIEPSEVFC